MEYEQIKNMIMDMGNSNVDELSLEFPDGVKIHMKKNAAKVVETTIPQTIQTVVKENTQEAKTEEVCYKEIKAPMVGTFYSKSSPKDAPFVKVGDHVKKGDCLCILEAMKLMNEIEAECDGEIVEICKKDEDMVEYGEVLFRLK